MPVLLVVDLPKMCMPGLPGDSFTLARSGRRLLNIDPIERFIRLVFSQTTFEELRTRIYRPKFDRYISLDDREPLLRDFNASAIWVGAGELVQYCRDRDDDHFIEAALKAQADYLVSGDKVLLEAPPVQGLHVVSVHQALEALGL